MAPSQSALIVSQDVDADFIETVVVALGWQYQALADRISEGSVLSDALQAEEFRRARAFCAMRALSHACGKHGVPFETRRLACNGQEKMIVKAGRVILIQEPIMGHADGPAIADYKVDLADMHGFVRQLELPLGDCPTRTTDWSGCVLAVLLHGPAGISFSRSSAALLNVFLGIPDAAYQQWIHRFDLHDIAMFGRSTDASPKVQPQEDDEQADNVIVTPKKRTAARKRV